MNFKSLLFICCVSICLVACRSKGTVAQNADTIVYLDNLIKFHTDHQLKGANFVLTVYKYPYKGHFGYIFLSRTNELHMAIDYSLINSAGYEHGEIQQDEIEDIQNVIDNLKLMDKRKTLETENTYIITISYPANTDGVAVFSCQNSDCPNSICKIYEIANEVSKRTDKSTPAQLVCPISYNE